jgi:hypothetical protein
VVGAVHLHVAARRPGPLRKLAGMLHRHPNVRSPVHHQQRPGRDGRHGLQRVHPLRRPPCRGGELAGRGGQEPGELALHLLRAERERATQARGCAVDRDRAQAGVGGGGQDGRPPAQAVAHHGDPPRVDQRAAGQEAGRRPHVARNGAQVVPARAAPAAAVVEEQGVPAAVAQHDRQVEVLLQAWAAVQQQRGGFGLVAAGQVEGADQAVAVAVEGDAGNALMFGTPVSSPHCPGP